MKNSLYPLKWPIVLLLTGFLVRIIGTLMKILHWIDANPILITGTLIMVFSILWLIIKLVLLKRQSI